MTVQKFAPEGFDLAIYAEPENLNYFLTTPITPASEGAIVNRTSEVRGHTRRQYVGDSSPINVSGGPRTYMYDPGRKVGNALPGEPFILDDGTERRQMTFSGNVIDLHAFLMSDAAMPLRLYTTGARHVIPASNPDPLR